jgi:mono/diheme cytochrome c family protein
MKKINKMTWLQASLVYALGLGTLSLLSLPGLAQESGEKVYKAKCAMCHGPDGAGTTPAGKATKARDFCSDEVKKETDEEWTQIIVKGKNKMPGYDKKLTDAEIKDVVGYIRTLCKK